MAIKSLEDRPKGPTPIEIDLTGPQGNAYYLLGLASHLCQKLKYDDARREDPRGNEAGRL